MAVTVGKRYLFTYPKQYTIFRKHKAHSGQIVEVLQQLETDLGEENCYSVRADDGWTGDVFESELTPI